MYLTPELLKAIRTIKQTHTGSLDLYVKSMRSVQTLGANSNVINFLSQKNITSLCEGMFDAINLKTQGLKSEALIERFEFEDLAKSQADKEIAIHKAALKELDEDYAATKNKIGFL